MRRNVPESREVKVDQRRANIYLIYYVCACGMHAHTNKHAYSHEYTSTNVL